MYKIGKDTYRINNDPHCWSIQKKGAFNTKKNEETWTPVGYYTELASVKRALVEIGLKTGWDNNKGFDQLAELVNVVKDQLKELNV